jgi:2-C-methyl-D-erythritol 2,4-cyclodiphosphate synthase
MVQKFRIGQGYDCHALKVNRPLIIGGVTIPHKNGLFGHSDADVLLHAIIDAMLGAAALGDIGHQFPDTNAQFFGADSRKMLLETMRLVHGAGYTVGNIDSTIVAQEPKMAPHIPVMIRNISDDCVISVGQVSVKSKTNEKLGYLGREEAIEAQAVVLLVCVS